MVSLVLSKKYLFKFREFFFSIINFAISINFPPKSSKSEKLKILTRVRNTSKSLSCRVNASLNDTIRRHNVAGKKNDEEVNVRNWLL